LVAERYNVLGKLELIKFDLTRDVDPQPLSPLPARPKNPAWAPDGRLAFSASQKVYEDIYVMPNDGSGAKLLVESDQDKEPTSWSPDGRQLAYVVFEVGAYGRNQDLWVASSENERGHALVANPAAIEVNAQFAPNPAGG
jgi:Tol biopolymer transport system component